MERDLHVRDKVGVQDFVLLENFNSEDAFIENLEKRSKEDLIYVSPFKKKTLIFSFTDLAYYKDLHWPSTDFGQPVQEPTHLWA